MRRVVLILIFLRTSILRGGGGMRCQTFFFCSLFPVRSRVSLLILNIQALPGTYSRDSSLSAAASIYLCKPPYVIVGPVPSLSCHTIVYLLRSLPRVRRHRASSPHGSSSNGCCLFAGHHRLINVRVSFPTPTIGMKCIINRGPPHSLFSMLYAAHILGSAMVCMYVCKVITYI